MTKREMFSAIIAKVQDNQEMVDFLNHEIELLDKKTTNRKPTAKQIENVAFSETLYEYLVSLNGEPKTIREVQAEVPNFADLTSQRIAKMLNTMVDKGKVTKVYVKKVPYFAVKTEE